jgi:DNA-binding LacI/PurR family transcriptional regulator
VLNALFQSRTPPTGILISHPRYLLTAMTYLAKLGLRVPEDVSLICMGDDEFLAHLVPSIARYAIDCSDYAKRFSHLVLLAAAGYLQPRHVSITARFQRGDSVAPVREK